MDWLRNLAHKVLQLTHGRTTAFFVAFFVAGNVLQFLGKLSMPYVYYMGTLGGLVLGHSIKEDVMASKMPRPPGGPDADNKS
jgi:undecaprenyl pyrophosphate phosphatase UppP